MLRTEAVEHESMILEASTKQQTCENRREQKDLESAVVILEL
jgi:hypothetical protein